MPQNTDQNEAAFERWKQRNWVKLINKCPETVVFHGAASNFSHWCRQVYTGRIKINLDN
jgi:hypothetical protein